MIPNNNEVVTYGLAWKMALDFLEPIYGQNEANALARIVFEHFFKLDRASLATRKNEPFVTENHEKLKEVLELLREEVPVQYITGVAHFFGLEFLVDERVLVPRPETEELVEWIVSDFNAGSFGSNHNFKILDIGTGSGCIAVSLAAKIAAARVDACDVSKTALEVASQNAEKNNVEVKFFECNILVDSLPPNAYDLVVSNPPYVMEKEKALMNKNVLDFEPHNALFVPNERPLVFYESIASIACKALKPNGRLYLEINENLDNQTINCLQNAGFVNIELKQDMKGKDRMIRAEKSSR